MAYGHMQLESISVMLNYGNEIHLYGKKKLRYWFAYSISSRALKSI